MATTKFDTRATVQKSALNRLAPTASPANRVELDNILASLDAQVTPPLEMRESASPNLVLNIGSISIQDPELLTHHTIPPISNLLPAFTSGTVTFPAASGSNATPSAGDPFLVTISNDSFLKVGISLDANGNMVLQAGVEGATEALATNPPLVPNTFPVGYVVLETVSTVIQSITNAKIYQYLGGGGGGSGSGDASSTLTRLWDTFQSSVYQEATGVDFSSDQSDQVDGGSTGTYSLVSSTFELPTIGNKLITTQLLSADEFLNLEKDITEAELVVFWNEDKIDPSATYKLSRDGGNEYQAVTMERVGSGSDTFVGRLIFADEAANQTLLQQATTDGGVDLGSTANQVLAQRINLTASSAIKQLELFVTKTGTPSGNIYIALHKDHATLDQPGDQVWQSAAIPVTGLATGAVTADLTQAVNDADDYWIMVTSDAAYKASYVDSTTELSFDKLGAGAGAFSYDGATWTDLVEGFKYSVYGRAHDLRLEVTSATTDVALVGYGVFYLPEGGIANGVKKRKRFDFLSNTDNTDTFDLGWVPDTDLLEVFYIQSGQVFRYDAFQVSGTNIVFPANTFQQGSDQTVTLFAVEARGSSFDNSDSNAALMGENHLGSSDGGIDRSSSGRGIVLRNANGDLREIGLDENDNFTISSLP